MKKIIEKSFKIIFSKKIITVLLVLLQIALLAGGYMLLRDKMQFIWFLVNLLSFVLVVYEINRESCASFKITWIVLILMIPILGGLLYIFLHANIVGSGINRRIARNSEESMLFMRQPPETRARLEEEYGSSCGAVRYLGDYCHFPAYFDTETKYYPIGEAMYEDMLTELKKAEKFIFMEYFIISLNDSMWQEILEILRRKAAAGVEVRIMYDGMGCVNLMPSDYPKQLEKLGIQCRVFSKVVPLLSTHQNNRDHRKITVIDGKVAFNGGINIADEYINKKERFGHWKDTGVKICGDAAASFTVMFLQMWNVMKKKSAPSEQYGNYIVKGGIPRAEAADMGVVIPFADSPMDKDHVAEQTYVDILNTAVNYVHIMTPYLVLDEVMMEAMKYAARRGVEVKLILPHIPDKPYAFMLARTYYKELMFAGVEIYEYTPGFIHAKSSVSDGKVAVVGTVNHDFRSLYLHYECGTYMLGNPAIADIEADFQATLALSQKMSYRDIDELPLYEKIFSSILRLLAPLM